MMIGAAIGNYRVLRSVLRGEGEKSWKAQPGAVLKFSEAGGLGTMTHLGPHTPGKSGHGCIRSSSERFPHSIFAHGESLERQGAWVFQGKPCPMFIRSMIGEVNADLLGYVALRSQKESTDP